MKSGSKLKYFFFFFLLGSVPVFSQKLPAHLKFQRFGAEQGLSVTTAFSIVQDDKGFLWVATIDGLLRYDGYKFIHFKNNYNDPNSISDNTVSVLAKGKGNAIWVGTYSGGLNRLDVNTGKFKRIQNNAGQKNSLSNNRVWSVYEDEGNILWIGTEHGLNRLDLVSGVITCYFREEGNDKTLCDNAVLAIQRDKNGILWIGTVNGLSRAVCDEKNAIKEFVNYKNICGDSNSLSGNIVMCFYESKDGTTWIGTNNGLSKFNKAANNFTCTRFSTSLDTSLKQVYSYLNSYGDNAVRAIYEDKAGNLWLSTDKGLKILAPASGRFIAYASEAGNATTISADLLSGMCEDRSGNLWIGTIVGGLNKVNLKPEKFRLYQTQNGNPYGLSKNNIRSLCVDSKNTLWVGTLEGGVNILNVRTWKFEALKNKEIETDNVWALFEDSRKNMWVGTSSGLYVYNRSTGEIKHFLSDKNNPASISDNIVRSIMEDSDGNLWIGTEGGLNKLDSKTGLFTRFLHDEKNEASLSHNTVWAVKEIKGTIWVATDNGLNKMYSKNGSPMLFKHFLPDKENKNSISNRSVRSLSPDSGNILWIGTSNGLNKFNYETETFTRYNEESGLANAYIYGVLDDAKGNLWISSNNGISRFNKKTLQFKNYDKYDGLQNNEFNTGAYFRSAAGELFFGGPDGFNSFFPDSLSENKIPPPVVITSVKIFGVEWEQGEETSGISTITLQHDQNVISFEFAALDLTAPEKNQYAYMLEGFDKDWVKAGTRRFVNYTNLDPGKYKFRVRASNSDGVWNEEGISLSLTIVPPFWKTWWFRIAALITLVFSLYIYFRNRINRLRKTQQLLEQQVTLKTKELREEKETVEQQNKTIEKKNHDITSSIRYAKRIQESILPAKEKLNELIPESFIFFKPKDIVSGDFYWFTRQNDITMVATVDCTGHGVPGAFMSLIGNNLLNEIVKNKKLKDPAKILEKLHEGLVLALKKSEHENDTVDGMDITLCVLDEEKKKLEVASSGRPFILIRNHEIKKYKIGKQPLGLVTKKEIKFEKEVIQLEKDDSFYLYTDGYCDQFGEEEDEKFMDAKLEKLLLSIQSMTMADQAAILEVEMDKWRGRHPQIDDMLVVGIRY